MSSAQGRAGYISALGMALRNGLLMVLLAVVGAFLFFGISLAPALASPEGQLVVLALVVAVSGNPLILLHCVLYIGMLSLLLWRFPRARRGRRHIGYSGLTALATGLPLVVLTLLNWGLDVFWAETPVAIFSTIMLTVVSLVVPAGLLGLRTLKRRFATGIRARRGP